MTTRQPLLIYIAMVNTPSLRKLAQAVLLALAAWVLTAGAASAHGGHSSTDAKPAAEASSHISVAHHAGLAATAADVEPRTEAVADHRENSCPTGAPAKHTGNCCTIACHAAMASPVVDAWIGPRVPSTPPAGLSDMLEGRCGDRSERPPRLV